MITIRECGEPLVDLRKACPGVILDLGPERMRYEKTAYLRRTVAKMVASAKRQLPSGMTFIIGDAWRPQEVQEEIFRRFTAMFSKKHPNWSPERVRKEVETYVAPATGLRASGHMTGAAVDLRLWKNGRKVPMKSRALSYQENALAIQPKLPPYIQQNRQLLREILTGAGLSNFPEEYWHWSYGDYWWAKRNKRSTAIYGVIKKL